MDWIESEPFWVLGPYAAEVFVWGETLEGLEPSGVVVRIHESLKMLSQLFVRAVVIPFDGRLLEGSVHPLDLSIGPRMIRFCQAMLDVVALTCAIERMPSELRRRAIAVLREVRELDAVVGQHDMDVVGDGLNQGVEKGRGGDGVGAVDELNEGELRGPVDADEEVGFAFGVTHFGYIDVEEADRVAPDLLLRWLVALDLRQAADAVALQAAMQG
jgi:hypothetical protein